MFAGVDYQDFVSFPCTISVCVVHVCMDVCVCVFAAGPLSTPVLPQWEAATEWGSGPNTDLPVSAPAVSGDRGAGWTGSVQRPLQVRWDWGRDEASAEVLIIHGTYIDYIHYEQITFLVHLVLNFLCIPMYFLSQWSRPLVSYHYSSDAIQSDKLKKSKMAISSTVADILCGDDEQQSGAATLVCCHHKEYLQSLSVTICSKACPKKWHHYCGNNLLPITKTSDLDNRHRSAVYTFLLLETNVLELTPVPPLTVPSCVCVMQLGKDHQAGGEGWGVLSLRCKRAKPLICCLNNEKMLIIAPPKKK